MVSALSHGPAIPGGLRRTGRRSRRRAGRRPDRGARCREGALRRARGVAEITAVRKSQLFRHARPEPNTLRKRLTWYG